MAGHEALNLELDTLKENTQLNLESKFDGLNTNYVNAVSDETTSTNDNAAKQVTQWIAAAARIDPKTTINCKGTYVDEFADAGNDALTKALGLLFGTTQINKLGASS